MRSVRLLPKLYRRLGALLDQSQWARPDADHCVLTSMDLHPVADIGSCKLPLDAISPDGITCVRPMVTSPGQIRRVGQRQERTKAFVSKVVVKFVHTVNQGSPPSWYDVVARRFGSPE